jgi:hypothetical protein
MSHRTSNNVPQDFESSLSICFRKDRVLCMAVLHPYCATSQKVAGSIPDGVMEFFIDINPSDRTMALGSTRPVTEMSTGIISWG